MNTLSFSTASFVLRLLLSALSVCAILGAFPAYAEHLAARNIYPDRELLITAPEVVDSAAAQYPGPWSFGGLIEQLVGPDKAGDCVRNWLETWNAEQKINNQTVAPRYGIFDKVILPWQTRDGYHADPDKPWIPQLQHAPFRLLAIVNRMDLCTPDVANTVQTVEDAWRRAGRERTFQRLLADGSSPAPSLSFLCYSGSPQSVRAITSSKSNAGEGRFVFCAVDDSGAPLAGDWTIILEYELNTSSDKLQVRNWASAWHSLGAWDVKSAAYRAALESVTRDFTHAQFASFAQLRSSEAAFGPGREFRQFSLSGTTLTPSSLTQTPGPIFVRKHSPEQRILAQFLHEREALIRDGIDRVPETVEAASGTIPLLGGCAVIPTNDSNFHWDFDRQISPETRRLFSFNTCNGCHGGETGCEQGLHIRPRATGAEAILSDFLRRDEHATRVDDPDSRGRKVVYNEMGDRAAILAALLEPSDNLTINALRPILRSRLSRGH